MTDVSEVTDYETETNGIKEVKIIVSAEITGRGKTWNYPYKDDNLYEIPTYKLYLIGTIGNRCWGWLLAVSC